MNKKKKKRKRNQLYDPEIYKVASCDSYVRFERGNTPLSIDLVVIDFHTCSLVDVIRSILSNCKRRESLRCCYCVHVVKQETFPFVQWNYQISY